MPAGWGEVNGSSPAPAEPKGLCSLLLQLAAFCPQAMSLLKRAILLAYVNDHKVFMSDETYLGGEMGIAAGVARHMT